jgi:hypothetical protein
MRISMSDEALRHIQQKGGKATVDLVCITG